MHGDKLAVRDEQPHGLDFLHLHAHLGFVGANRWRERWGRMPLVALMTTAAIIAAQPVALVVQRDITTSSDASTLRITRIERRESTAMISHFIATEG